jgi:hypothetical protein
LLLGFCRGGSAMHVKLVALIATAFLVVSGLPSQAGGYKYSSSAYYSYGHKHSTFRARHVSRFIPRPAPRYVPRHVPRFTPHRISRPFPRYVPRYVPRHVRKPVKTFCRHYERRLDHLVPVSMGRFIHRGGGYKTSGRHRKHAASTGRAHYYRHGWGKRHYKPRLVRWCKHKPVSP